MQSSTTLKMGQKTIKLMTPLVQQATIGSTVGTTGATQKQVVNQHRLEPIKSTVIAGIQSRENMEDNLAKEKEWIFPYECNDPEGGLEELMQMNCQERDRKGSPRMVYDISRPWPIKHGGYEDKLAG